jgi:uncharacterized protein (TIGR02611 family)
MSAGFEDRGGREPRAGTGFAPPHQAHRVSRSLPSIPTSPATAPPAQPDAARPASTSPGPAQTDSAQTDPAQTGAAQSAAAQAGAAQDGAAPSGTSPADPAHPDSIGPTSSDGASEPRGKHHHHVLIEPNEDRWAWRRRIRQNPHKLRVYRVGVGVLGLLLICLGIVTGPLPGPGGIPLVLLGLAIWSSEFEWAYKLRQRFKAEVRKFHGWSTGQKVAFWVVFFAACGCLGYSYLLMLGVPFWMPDVGASLLDHLPGVEAPS